MQRLSLLLCFALPGVVFANLYQQRPTIQVGKYYQYEQQSDERSPAHSSEENTNDSQQQAQQKWYQPQMEFVKEIQFNRGQRRPDQMYRQTKETEIRKIMKKIQRNNGNTWSGLWLITPQQQQEQQQQQQQQQQQYEQQQNQQQQNQQQQYEQQQQQDLAASYNDAAQSLKKIDDEEKAAFHSAVMAAMNDEDTQLNATELLQKYQYGAEKLSVKTDDGYYLTVIRIPAQQNSNNKVAFLMHGLLGSADDWLAMGPGKSLAYQLADAGYDVYLGNARGNKYSRRHATKHPAAPDFWQFSNDEIVQQDLPAMIDAALDKSQSNQLYYVGHSQGAADLLALIAEQPQYNDKIKMMIALAPLAFMSHAQSPYIRMLANTDDERALSRGQFQPQAQQLQSAGGAMCKEAIGCNRVCSNPLFAIAGVNGAQLEASRVPVILAHADTTSARVMHQLGQRMVSGNFMRYDYGAQVNEQVYGQQSPPAYELSNVRVPVVMYYGQRDLLAHPADVQSLQQQLPNVIESNQVPDEYFTHTDYVFSKNAPDYIYKNVINTMNNN